MEFASFVLAASTADLTIEPQARSHADVLEFRLDLAEAPLEQLAVYDGDLPVIATNRIHTEGGQAPDGQERLDILLAAIEHPSVTAVDIELSAIDNGSGNRVVTAAQDHDVAVIVSAHDFEGTPSMDAMTTTLQASVSAGEIGKLAVTATDPGDVLDLLRVTWSFARDDLPVATMAMGPTGRHSRAIAPAYGSRIGYAPVEPADATAPGQYDLATLRRLIDTIGAWPPAANGESGRTS